LPVLHVHLFVAFAALEHCLFDRFVRVVAVLTRNRGVHRQALMDVFCLERSMASRAVPLSEYLRLRAENMAGVAIRGRAVGVQMGERSLFLMALGADAGVWCLEGV